MSSVYSVTYVSGSYLPQPSPPSDGGEGENKELTSSLNHTPTQLRRSTMLEKAPRAPCLAGGSPLDTDMQSLKAAIHPAVRIGHVHLKVADLERALGFYHRVLGFEITQRYGSAAVFLSAGGYHHHIGLNTWESFGGHPPMPGTTGLYHLAIIYPTRALLADALRRVISAGIELDGASDHGVSEALYLRDPDNNGVELYWDRPQEQWPRLTDGSINMVTNPLNLEKLLEHTEPAL